MRESELLLQKMLIDADNTLLERKISISQHYKVTTKPVGNIHIPIMVKNFKQNKQIKKKLILLILII